MVVEARTCSTRPGHANARLTTHGRRPLIDRIQTFLPVAHVADEIGISAPTEWRWLRRLRRASDRPDRSRARGLSARSTSAQSLGLRWGECAGLRVGRVNLDRSTLAVAEQITRGEHGEPRTGPPKSNAGNRTLSVPKPLAELLAGHLDRRSLTTADCDAFLFTMPEGGPLVYQNWRMRSWLPACRAVGLEGLGFHDLRRLNATGLVMEGVDVKTAQTRLGHSDPRLTLAVYAQATTEADRAAAQRLGERFMSEA